MKQMSVGMETNTITPRLGDVCLVGVIAGLLVTVLRFGSDRLIHRLDLPRIRTGFSSGINNLRRRRSEQYRSFPVHRLG